MVKNNFEPKWLVVAGFFLSGVFLGSLGLFIWIFNGNSLYGLQKIHPKNANYKFINPLLAVDTFEKKEFLENKSLEGKVRVILEKASKQGQIKESGVYFRDLEAGRWMGINEEGLFSPGKLFKVPIMIAYFKGSESDSKLLDKMLVYKVSPANQTTKNNENLEIGKAYTVNDLIVSMIVNDDENAADVLFDNIDKNSLSEIYSDLGINFSEDKNVDDYISLKFYSLIFRVLYNSTYLGRATSEEALDILSQISTAEGIASGLPNDLKIAHEYHTRTFEKDGQVLVESYDCGIVYFPNYPYLLCVTATGKDKDLINQLFKQISQIVRREMISRYRT